MRLIYVGVLICLFGSVKAQTGVLSKKDVLNKFGFQEHSIVSDNDTIFFYFHKKPKAEPKHLVLYLQGTSPDPLFSIEEENGQLNSYRWFPGDYNLLDDSYGFVVVAKTGIPAILGEGTNKNIAKYQKFNSLDNRVFKADTVINFICNNLLKNLDKVIVYGHSEGAPVAAKLGTVNKKITHLGFWAGNALPDYFDFILFNTKALNSGKLSSKEAFKNIDEIIEGFKEIAKNPTDISYTEEDDYTNKRWWSYAEPPIDHLLKIDIPIFVQVAGNDKSAPIESTFLIPLEFTRMGKTNLTYKVCAECDHGFGIEKQNGEFEDKWSEIFQDFIKWTKENTP